MMSVVLVVHTMIVDDDQLMKMTEGELVIDGNNNKMIEYVVKREDSLMMIDVIDTMTIKTTITDVLIHWMKIRESQRKLLRGSN